MSHKSVMAVAVENKVRTDSGQGMFFNTNGEFLAENWSVTRYADLYTPSPACADDNEISGTARYSALIVVKGFSGNIKKKPIPI